MVISHGTIRKKSPEKQIQENWDQGMIYLKQKGLNLKK